jgi:hypothetical protein
LQLTDPRTDVAGFVCDLRRHLERRPCAALIPGSDYSLFAVSRERNALEPLTRIGLPRHEVVQRAFNREVLGHAAEIAGLSPAGAVRCVDSAQAVDAARDLGYPVLLKSISTVRDLGPTVAAGADTRRVADERELRAVLGHYGDAWLVQQCVSGRTLSFGGVIAQGRLLGAAVSEYRRTWPPAAGNVSFSVTISPPPGLQDQVAALLRHVGWEGLFELELIEQPQGAITPIDLNPRPYGSMALAVASGANLPALWCDWLLDRGPDALRPRSNGSRRLTPPVQAQAGRAYRWEDADFRHLVWQLRHRHYSAAAQVIRPWPAVVHPHLRAADPLPFLVRMLSLAVGKLRHAWRQGPRPARALGVPPGAPPRQDPPAAEAAHEPKRLHPLHRARSLEPRHGLDRPGGRGRPREPSA